MARATFESWLPEEKDSSVMTRVNSTSAVEALARRLPMNSTTKSFPRSGGMDVDEVAKGAAYGEDTSANDEVTLTAKKFGKAIRIAEEDIDDSLVGIIEAKKNDWASSYAKFLDNACLATTAAPGAGVPFQSVYNAVRTADASTGYTADANYISTTSPDPDGAGPGVADTESAVTYADLSAVLALAEASDSFDEGGLIVIAHGSFKGAFRDLVDGNGRPLFVEGQGNVGSTLFGYPVRWSQGAKTSATATSRPTGNPLLIVGQRDSLMLGVRSGPESVVIDGRDGASALTDETILKMRARRGFAVAYPDAFAVLEVTP